MRSRRGKSGAPPCIVMEVNEDGMLEAVGHHQWHGRNVHGFVIKWYICEFCGLTMHQLTTNNVRDYPIYEFIQPYTIEEMPA